MGYFQNLFSLTSPIGIVESLRGVSARVTSNMNSQLLREFTSKEIDFVLFEMHPLKAPSPMGFQLVFTNVIGQQWGM